MCHSLVVLGEYLEIEARYGLETLQVLQAYLEVVLEKWGQIMILGGKYTNFSKFLNVNNTSIKYFTFLYFYINESF